MLHTKIILAPVLQTHVVF